MNIGLPDESARIDILMKLLKDINVSDFFNYRYCAKLTEGFSSSDLVALCKAAISSIKRDKNHHFLDTTIQSDDMNLAEESSDFSEGTSHSPVSPISSDGKATVGRKQTRLKSYMRPLSITVSKVCDFLMLISILNNMSICSYVRIS